MKLFLKFILVVMTLGVVASCNKEQDEVVTQTRAEFIESELKALGGDVDVASLRNALNSFDQTVEQAFTLQLNDEAQISDLFMDNAQKFGMPIAKSDLMLAKRGEVAEGDVQEVPEELLLVLDKLVQTVVGANSLDQYIANLGSFKNVVRGSSLTFSEKSILLTSVFFLEITAKLIKKYPPKWLNDVSPNEKWVKQIKCAFESLTMGLSGALTGCAQGSAILKPIGSAFGGAEGSAVGSIVGCSIGALIKGLINIAETAEACIQREGLD